MREADNPTPKDVQEIFKFTYLFYTKWIAVKEPKWDELISESHSLEQKYPYDLCRTILVELVAALETDYMERSKENVS
jgi:hypothetical protein